MSKVLSFSITYTNMVLELINYSRGSYANLTNEQATTHFNTLKDSDLTIYEIDKLFANIGGVHILSYFNRYYSKTSRSLL